MLNVRFHEWIEMEQVLEERMCASWRKYAEALEDDVDDDVHWRQMTALYDAYDDALQLLEKLEHNDADAQFISLQHQRIDKYRYRPTPLTIVNYRRESIVKLFIWRERIEWRRRQYYSGVRQRTDGVKRTMDAWRRLKELRRSQGFTTTTCKLTWKKKIDASGTDSDDECRRRRRWDDEIRRQIDERRLAFQRRCQMQRDQYKTLKAQWKLMVPLRYSSLTFANYGLDESFQLIRIDETI